MRSGKNTRHVGAASAAITIASRSRLKPLLLAWLVLAAPSLANVPDPAAPRPSAASMAETEVPGAPVKLDDRKLFDVRGSSSVPAEERAGRISARLEKVASDRQIEPDAITVVTTPYGEQIQAGDTQIMTVLPADGDFEGLDQRTLAQSHLSRIRDSVVTYRNERTPERLLRGALVSLLATVLFVVLFRLFSFGYGRAEALLERRYRPHLDSLPLQSGNGTDTSLWRTIRASARATHWVLRLAIAFVCLQVVLSQFPWTRWAGDGLASLLFGPLEGLGHDFVEYLPKLFFLIVLTAVARAALRLFRLYFDALDRKSAALPNFDAEWAMPTYKIVRVAVIALALIMAYPYLPGAGTEALQGVSVFAGLMLSLGASSAVSGVISGYINTFGRVFKVGDLIEVGAVRGVVTQVRLLTTRVRTIRNEEVTIPNSTITSNHVINFSALARERGLVLQTEVGIGYEVPWRQVHAMLLEAAARTADLLADPAPFIIQRKLGDFAIVYQLNVHKGSADGLMLAYSGLHQNILDVFNEQGVQIMTPAYEGDPPEPKVVPKDQVLAPPAKPRL